MRISNTKAAESSGTGFTKLDTHKQFVKAIQPLVDEYGERQWDHGRSPGELLRALAVAFIDNHCSQGGEHAGSAEWSYAEAIEHDTHAHCRTGFLRECRLEEAP